MALPPQTNSASNDKKAQQAAAQQDVFMREVDDALRQDQMEGFMKSWGKPLLVIIVIGLLGFAGWLYWDHRQTSEREAHSETYVQALDSLNAKNFDDARAKLESLAALDGSDASITSARLLLAGIALEQDRSEDALKLYRQVAADEKAPQELRDLAAIREVAANFDAMEPQAVIDRLKPMAAPGNGWFGVAGEMVAMAYLKQDKPDQAGPLFAAIAKDEAVDENVRSRARQLAAVLGVDAVDDVVDETGKGIEETEKSAGENAGEAGEKAPEANASAGADAAETP